MLLCWEIRLSECVHWNNKDTSIERWMMKPLTREVVMQCIQDALTNVLETRSVPQIADLSESTPLFGERGCLDSMGLVMLIIDVEQWINDNSEQSLVLVDAKAMSRRNSPFRSIGTMLDFIMDKVMETKDNA